MTDQQNIKAVKIFSSLRDNQIQLFIPRLKERKLKAGEVLFAENDKGSELFILTMGQVSISKKMSMVDHAEMDKNIITLSAKDHPFFGEIGLLCDQVRTATVTALSNCVVLVLSRSDFMDICSNNPDVGFKVTTEIARHLSVMLTKTDENVLKLATALVYALR